MNVLEFEITFHTPFRVSTGTARSGVDSTVDLSDPLPATSLKGVMRASATCLLGENATVIADVFGSVGAPTPWRWTKAMPDAGGWHKPVPTARISIDPCAHTARPDMLGTAEQTGARRATFTVTQWRPLRDNDTLELHRLVLAVAGQAVRSLGGDRRRGLGWVTVRCPSVALDEAATRRFLECARVN